MKNKKLNILFRVNSSSTIGLGHVMRCLVLAKRLKSENKKTNITFATQSLHGNINTKIVQDGFKVVLLKSTKKSELINLIEKMAIDLLVIDSYDISSKYEKKLINRTKTKVLVFDDMFQKHSAHMVLNHGLQVHKKKYKKLVSKKTKLFCGAKYTLLRDEFFKTYKQHTDKNKIAIILGGNDIQNLSLKVLQILQKIDSKYEITIITTSVNPNLSLLKKAKKMKLLIDIENVAKTLSKHSLIICASGGNLFEVIALKKRFINIKIAKNQDSIVKFLKKQQIFTTLNKDKINKKNLQEKINYVLNNDVYEKLTFKFSQTTLAKEILSELK